jgi:hypothetical protein
MTVLITSEEIVYALNSGKYTVLSYDIDKKEGSIAKVDRNGFYTNCKLQKGLVTKDDNDFYLSHEEIDVKAFEGAKDYVEMAEYANAPIIKKGQKVAILLYSKNTNGTVVLIAKAGNIDGDCSIVTEFRSIGEEELELIKSKSKEFNRKMILGKYIK